MPIKKNRVIAKTPVKKTNYVTGGVVPRFITASDVKVIASEQLQKETDNDLKLEEDIQMEEKVKASIKETFGSTDVPHTICGIPYKDCKVN